MFSDVIDARSRGVLFDVGHGAGGFNWTVAELAIERGFYPDLLGRLMFKIFFPTRPNNTYKDPNLSR